jgi:hypothetical protein
MNWDATFNASIVDEYHQLIRPALDRMALPFIIKFGDLKAEIMRQRPDTSVPVLDFPTRLSMGKRG